MAKIGNETSLILKLAKERMNKNLGLEQAVKWVENPGNHYEPREQFEYIWKMAIESYKDTLLGIVSELENR